MGISVINVYDDNKYKASNNQYICRELDEEIYWQPVKRIFVMNDVGQWKAAQYPSTSNNPDEPNYPTSFADATWEQIVRATSTQANILNVWSIGEKHSLKMSDGTETTVTIIDKAHEAETDDLYLVLAIDRILFTKFGSNYYDNPHPTEDDSLAIKSLIGENIVINNIKYRTAWDSEDKTELYILPTFFSPTYEQIMQAYPNVSDRIRSWENPYPEGYPQTISLWWTSSTLATTIPDDDGSGFNPEDYEQIDTNWKIYIDENGNSQVLIDNGGMYAGICPAFWI